MLPLELQARVDKIVGSVVASHFECLLKLLFLNTIYSIFTYIYHENQPNVGKYIYIYIIHGLYGIVLVKFWSNCSDLTQPGPSKGSKLEGKSPLGRSNIRISYRKHSLPIFIRELWLVVRVKLMEINSRLARFYFRRAFSHPGFETEPELSHQEFGSRCILWSRSVGRMIRWRAEGKKRA